MSIEAVCSMGIRTVLSLAGTASDRAGSLDSNTIIISPFKSSTFFHYSQQCKITSSNGWRFLGSLCALSLSFYYWLSPPQNSFLAKSRQVQWGRFSQAAKGYFIWIPNRSLPVTNVWNHLQENVMDSFNLQRPSNSVSYCIVSIWFIFVGHSLHFVPILCFQSQCCTVSRWWTLVGVLQEKQVWCNYAVI